jgi:arabinofuranosyltransferase
MRQSSTSSIWNIDPRLLISIAALAGVGYFLIVSALTYRIGFPLDDAWIHLTYARNFVEYGEWAFRLGQGSAGSTSPLWTALLSIGYLIRLAPYAWTYFLGWVILSIMGIRAENIARKTLKSYRSKVPWVGLFMVLAWHLTWSATSGMETLLHGLIILIVLGMLMEKSPQYLTLGLLTGLSVWVRPDGLTLLGPILFTAFIHEKTLKERGNALLKVLIGFGILFVFYLLFNLALSGTPMPNTFYAKQAEYQEFWLAKPLSERLTDYLLPIIASPFIVLVPGFFLWIYMTIRERNWGALAGLIWFLGYVGIYFSRLPAYQHGRYIIPAFPVLYLWGMIGMLGYIASPKANQRITLVWQTLVVILLFTFQWVGAKQNAQDVVLIETQMVRTAQWMNEHLPADAVLAVHDIGAIGYFTKNPMVDLAGLVTPDVVPFIRDETRLEDYLNSRKVDFLVTFPGWYPQMIKGREILFQAGLSEFPFEENMSVYRWR